MMMKRSTNRATPIMLVRATCRVPVGLMPVTAATAVMTIARMSQVYQVMPGELQKARHRQLDYRRVPRAAVTGIKPTGTRHVARTSMMGVARFVLLFIIIVFVYMAYRARSG